MSQKKEPVENLTKLHKDLEKTQQELSLFEAEQKFWLDQQDAVNAELERYHEIHKKIIEEGKDDKESLKACSDFMDYIDRDFSYRLGVLNKHYEEFNKKLPLADEHLNKMFQNLLGAIKALNEAMIAFPKINKEIPDDVVARFQALDGVILNGLNKYMDSMKSLNKKERTLDNEGLTLKNKIKHIQNKINDVNSSAYLKENFQPKASSLEKFTKQKDEYILFACHVHHDGIGDLGHYIDVVNYILKNNLIPGYKPLFLISYHEPKGEKHLKDLKDMLTSAGFDLKAPNLHLVPQPRNLSVDASRKAESPPNPFNTYIHQEPLKTQLKNTQAMFSISLASAMNPYINTSVANEGFSLKELFDSYGKAIPCTSIWEHGARDYSINESIENSALNPLNVSYFMGSHEKGQGFLLKKPVGQNNKVSPLSQIKNQKFLNVLLNRDKKLESPPDEKETAAFLKESLLIPCYFQTGSKDFLDFINIIASSPIAAQYKEIVIVTSKKDQTYPEREKYQGLLADNINQINFYKNDSETDPVLQGKVINIKRGKSDKPPLNVRVIEGFWLNDEDRDCLYQAAPIFEGCSGDKTFDAALGHGHIPFHQKKEQELLYFQWYVKAVMEYELEKKGNQEKDLVTPYIQKMIDFQISGDRSPDFIRLTRPKVIQEMSSLLTPQLVEQWKIIAKDLQQHQNFYHQLPSIVRKTLQVANMASSLKMGSELKDVHDQAEKDLAQKMGLHLKESEQSQEKTQSEGQSKQSQSQSKHSDAQSKTFLPHQEGKKTQEAMQKEATASPVPNPTGKAIDKTTGKEKEQDSAADSSKVPPGKLPSGPNG